MSIPPNLKAILDERAGKEHSEDGKVAQALEEILQEHKRMIRKDPHGMLWGDFLSAVSLATPGAFTVSKVVDHEPWLEPVEEEWRTPDFYFTFRTSWLAQFAGEGVEKIARLLHQHITEKLAGYGVVTPCDIYLLPVISATFRGVAVPREA